jgi:hypothetical protein
MGAPRERASERQLGNALSPSIGPKMELTNSRHASVRPGMRLSCHRSHFALPVARSTWMWPEVLSSCSSRQSAAAAKAPRPRSLRPLVPLLKLVAANSSSSLIVRSSALSAPEGVGDGGGPRPTSSWSIERSVAPADALVGEAMHLWRHVRLARALGAGGGRVCVSARPAHAPVAQHLGTV